MALGSSGLWVFALQMFRGGQGELSLIPKYIHIYVCVCVHTDLYNLLLTTRLIGGCLPGQNIMSPGYPMPSQDTYITNYIHLDRLEKEPE